MNANKIEKVLLHDRSTGVSMVPSTLKYFLRQKQSFFYYCKNLVEQRNKLQQNKIRKLSTDNKCMNFHNQNNLLFFFCFFVPWKLVPENFSCLSLFMILQYQLFS